MSLRLDEMNIDEVNQFYKDIFNEELTESEFNLIKDKYEKKYAEACQYRDNGYKTAGGMGRGFKYTLNILYGWYIEDLIKVLLLKNKDVRTVELTGNDSTHNFIFSEDKQIKIEGEKTTTPDFLITLNDGRKFYIELKTAAAGIFTIKKGNVMQLYKTMGQTGIYSIVIMIDIVNGLYDIRDINYFTNLHPFVNQRMEGQLCYSMPAPDKDFINLISENFLSEYNPDIFKNENVIKYKLLKIAENNKDLSKLIKSKISYDNKIEEFEYLKLTHEAELKKMEEKNPEIINLSWTDIQKILKQN